MGYEIYDRKCLPTYEVVAQQYRLTETVMPAKAGIHKKIFITYCFLWIPAFAGITNCTLLRRNLSKIT
jgi:hypothetical protein